MLSAYLLGMLLVPSPSKLWRILIFSELGIIELGTAGLYLATCVLALLVGLRLRGVPARYRGMFIFVAAVALFICLEETNYGQYFFDTEGSDWYSKHAKKKEINLHKMAGHMPARRMNAMASIAFPTWCLGLPLLGTWRKTWWSRGHWSTYILPRLELALIVVLAQAMGWLDDLFRQCGWRMNVWARASEFKELYWSLAAFLMAALLWRRLRYLRLPGSAGSRP